MSKAAAIHTAILLQMASEGKDAPDLNKPLGPVTTTGTAATTTAGPYDKATIRGFLANVAFRLRGDTPPLAFDWTAIDQEAALADKLWVLELTVANVTISLPSPEVKDPPES